MKAFLAYGLADRSFVSSLQQEMLKLGIVPAEEKPREGSGESYTSGLRNAIESSDALILVVPEMGGNRANSAFFEAGVAKALGKPVLVVMPDLHGREFPSYLADYAVFDASRKPLANVARSLAVALEAA